MRSELWRRVALPWRRTVRLEKEIVVLLRMRCVIAVLPILIGGCRAWLPSGYSDCEQVDEVMAITETIPSYKGRSAAVYRASQLELAADKLRQMTIADGELAGYGDALAALYHQSSDLILQETAFMEDDGTVSVAASGHAAYQQVLIQRAELTLQVQAQHDLVQAYCGQ